MHIEDIFAANQTTFSFEFFPPKTAEGTEVLFEEIAKLQPLHPQFVSVTYGAGGSTRERTHDLVMRIRRETEMIPIPHLTCVCHSEEEIRSILETYAQAGIENILALGGDPPRDMPNHDRSQDAFSYASDLVKFIREFNASGAHPDGRGFGVGVAGFPEGHPGTPNRQLEMDFLKAKVEAGADYICTQLFFDNYDFHDWVERCHIAGVDVPIVAGVMPITSKAMFNRLPDFAGGSRYPAELLRRIYGCGDDDKAIMEVGVNWAIDQCRDLIAHGVNGIHFYTLNKSHATARIYEALGLPETAARA